MMDCKKALEESGGDQDKAVELLRTRNMAKADKRADRHAAEGLIEAYVHFNGRVAVLVELNCETDFVARTDAFRQLAKDVALHIASAAPIAVRIEDVPREAVGGAAEDRRGAVEEVLRRARAARAEIREGRLAHRGRHRARAGRPDGGERARAPLRPLRAGRQLNAATPHGSGCRAGADPQAGLHSGAAQDFRG